MSVQQIVFAETIAGMKRAVARQTAGSDEEDVANELPGRVRPFKTPSQQHARSLLDGDSVYKRPEIEHAGYKRHIISRNPPRFDEDGDEIDDFDDDDSADLSAAEDNPYGDVKLEELLAPLTSAADLATHPSLSQAYYSKHLTNLANSIRTSLQQEESLLEKMKLILSRLLGDDPWVPVGMMETEYDLGVLEGQDMYAPGMSTASNEEHLERQASDWAQASNPLSFADNGPRSPPQTSAPKVAPAARDQEDIQMGEGDESHGAHTTNGASTAENNGVPPPEGLGAGKEEDGIQQLRQSAQADPSTIRKDQEDSFVTKGTHAEPTESNVRQDEAEDQMQVDGQDSASKTADEPSQAEEDADDINSQPTSRRMRTRAQAHANSSPTHSPRMMTPESPVAHPIHPLFSFPVGQLADRDVGLPAGEADETRQWLLLYCQKKEETVRQMRQLHEGLMEADRKRQLVLKWSKAEGHIGEMSDGEDWVDKEEWGLTEDLVKGREEEEEEGVVQGKKTRARGRREDK